MIKALINEIKRYNDIKEKELNLKEKELDLKILDMFAFHTKYGVWVKQEVTTPQVVIGTAQTYENYSTSSMMKNP